MPDTQSGDDVVRFTISLPKDVNARVEDARHAASDNVGFDIKRTQFLERIVREWLDGQGRRD